MNTEKTIELTIEQRHVDAAIEFAHGIRPVGQPWCCPIWQSLSEHLNRKNFLVGYVVVYGEGDGARNQGGEIGELDKAGQKITALISPDWSKIKIPYKFKFYPKETK